MVYGSIENNKYWSDYVYAFILVPLFWDERYEYTLKWQELYEALFSVSEGELKHFTYSLVQQQRVIETLL